MWKTLRNICGVGREEWWDGWMTFYMKGYGWGTEVDPALLTDSPRLMEKLG